MSHDELEEEVWRQCNLAGVVVIGEDIRTMKRAAIELSRKTTNGFEEALSVLAQMSSSLPKVTFAFTKFQLAMPCDWEKPLKQGKNWKHKTIWDRV